MQELLPKFKINDKQIRILKEREEFSRRLQACLHDKRKANDLLADVRSLITTTIKNKVRNTKGYVFTDVTSYSGQSNVVVLKAMSDKDPSLCAKISVVKDIKKELLIGNTVKGSCIMPSV